jgi:hypothetical protein
MAIRQVSSHLALLSYDVSKRKSTKVALNVCLKYDELHLEMETFMTAIQEQAVTH